MGEKEAGMAVTRESESCLKGLQWLSSIVGSQLRDSLPRPQPLKSPATAYLRLSALSPPPVSVLNALMRAFAVLTCGDVRLRRTLQWGISGQWMKTEEQ